jgi:hypothetical protein
MIWVAPSSNVAARLPRCSHGWGLASSQCGASHRFSTGRNHGIPRLQPGILMIAYKENPALRTGTWDTGQGMWELPNAKESGE